jgi:metal-responsive CopG/Arc/MetJ family transcriptional regulator
MSYRTAICVRLDKKLLKRFDEFAGDEGYTRSEAAREAIRRFLRQNYRR